MEGQAVDMNLRGDCTLKEAVPDDTKIHIVDGNLKILNTVGKRVVIVAAVGKIGGKVQIRGPIGRECQINAYNTVEVHDVGDRSTLHSTVGKIRCHQVGAGVTLAAQKTVTFGSMGPGSTVQVRKGNIQLGQADPATHLVCSGTIKRDPSILTKMLADRNRTKY